MVAGSSALLGSALEVLVFRLVILLQNLRHAAVWNAVPFLMDVLGRTTAVAVLPIATLAGMQTITVAVVMFG